MEILNRCKKDLVKIKIAQNAAQNWSAKFPRVSGLFRNKIQNYFQNILFANEKVYVLVNFLFNEIFEIDLDTMIDEDIFDLSVKMKMTTQFTRKFRKMENLKKNFWSELTIHIGVTQMINQEVEKARLD